MFTRAIVLCLLLTICAAKYTKPLTFQSTINLPVQSNNNGKLTENFETARTTIPLIKIDPEDLSFVSYNEMYNNYSNGPADIQESKNNVKNECKCVTANYTLGICIDLEDCPSINAMSNDFDTPMTLERMRYLIKSQCGFNGTRPKVCCPKEEASHNLL